MKRNNINYLLVGGLVLVSMTLLIYALARLSGHNERRDMYYTTFLNVAGIADGTPVTYDGYQVGQVQSITPVNRDGRIHYRVQLLFKQGWKIPVDSIASISSSGLLSGQIVDVQQGKSQDFLKPGQDVRAVDNPPLFAALGGLAGDLRSIVQDDMRPTLQNLNRRVDSFGGMIEHKGGMTLDQANIALVRLNVAAENLGQLLSAENRQHMSNILRSGDQATERVNQTVSEFEQAGADVRYAMQQTQAVLSNLEQASRHMNELSRQLRESPSAIFSSPAPVDPSEAKK